MKVINIDHQKDLSMHMRNVIEKIKGALYSRRPNKEEQVKANKKWNLIAKGYINDNPNTTEYKLFIDITEKYQRLWGRFTNIGKMNELLENNEFNILYKEFLDLTYSILKMVV